MSKLWGVTINNMELKDWANIECKLGSGLAVTESKTVDFCV